jgi:hypothetical protein
MPDLVGAKTVQPARRLSWTVPTLVAAADYSCVIVTRSARKSGRPARITTTVPAELAVLYCPSCDAVLAFESSTEGGVAPIEHWDRYRCQQCRGMFEYRRRTRALKRTA